MHKFRIKKTKDLTVAYFYIFFLYISLPFMPGFWAKLTGYLGNFVNYIAAVILIAIGILIGSYLFYRQKAMPNFIWLLILAFAYAWGLKTLELSIERIHFIEYGLLSLLVFRALRHSIRDKSIYFWSGIIVFCLGLIDEGIQYILPNRVYDTRDVIVNGIAGILGLLLIRLCLEPKIEV